MAPEEWHQRRFPTVISEHKAAADVEKGDWSMGMIALEYHDDHQCGQTITMTLDHSNPQLGVAHTVGAWLF